MKKFILKPVIFSLICTSVLVSCGDEPKPDKKVDEAVFDENNPLHAIFDDKIFSIPSPVQTGYLIKQLDLKFDKTLLNPEINVNDYVSEHKQALNLGIYGTDLGYCSLYSQKSTSMSYLNSVEKLTAKLGLDAAFDTNFLSKFESNNGDEDKMIKLMSQAFKKADNFLKNANRKSTSALILSGGWIESIYFACELNQKKSSDEIKRRIGEQKQSLVSIVELLTEYNVENKNDELIAQLEDLKVSFDKIEMTYEYEAPETDKEKHLTIFNHSFNVEFDQTVVDEITQKVKAIRNSITKA
ncbi:MAG: hypothetical protein HRT57_02570 [Crocinitomicaceae bacterium]|nr:hypothetical protein [Crocinitomicaceae bacterium]